MIPPDWTGGFGGGVLIGLASVGLLALNGRIAGIAGIVGGVMNAPGDRAWRLTFLAGLVLGAGLYAALADGLPQEINIGWTMITIAGLLVGVGTRLGSGCTSGHGICGLARRSSRSLTATMTFIASGVVTVFIVRHVIA